MAPTCQSTFIVKAVVSCDLTPTALISPILLGMQTSVYIQSAGSASYVTQIVQFKDTVSVAKGDDVITGGPR
jgi:hypothetical protein